MVNVRTIDLEEEHIDHSKREHRIDGYTMQ